MQVNSSFPRPVDEGHTLSELFEKTGSSTVLFGDPNVSISSVAAPETAASGSLVFLNKRGDRLRDALSQTAASVAIVEEAIDFLSDTCTVVLAEDARAWFINALDHLFRSMDDVPFKPGARAISPDAVIAPDVEISAGALVGAQCIIGAGTRIGANCVIHPGTRIGEGCFIQDGTVIGSVGLGYHFTASGERLFVPHLGRVQIEDHAVIGTGCTIVRGQLSDTIIGHSARLGNHVNVGHNVSIGDNTVMSSSSSIAGGAMVGARCNIAVGVAVNSKIKIGDESTIGLGSVVTKSLPARSRVFGNPARALPTLGKF